MGLVLRGWKLPEDTISPAACAPKGTRLTRDRLTGFSAPEGLLSIGKAQKPFPSFRVIKTASPYPG